MSAGASGHNALLWGATGRLSISPGGYAKWLAAAETLWLICSPDEQADIFGGKRGAASISQAGGRRTCEDRRHSVRITTMPIMTDAASFCPDDFRRRRPDGRIWRPDLASPSVVANPPGRRGSTSPGISPPQASLPRLPIPRRPARRAVGERVGVLQDR